jgi:hypothetical protein
VKIRLVRPMLLLSPELHARRSWRRPLREQILAWLWWLPIPLV